MKRRKPALDLCKGRVVQAKDKEARPNNANLLRLTSPKTARPVSDIQLLLRQP